MKKTITLNTFRKIERAEFAPDGGRTYTDINPAPAAFPFTPERPRMTVASCSGSRLVRVALPREVANA